MDSTAHILILVEQAQSGDRAAFDRLVIRYRPRLESLVRLRLGKGLHRRLDPEDVVQESLLRAYRSIATFKPQRHGSFFGWLAKIAENLVLEVKRHHLGTQKASLKREVPLARPCQDGSGTSGALGDLLAAELASPSQHLRRDERFARLEDALEELSADHREVILLATIQGVPIKEIARRMNRSPGAASMLLIRALRQLKEIFGATESLHLPPRVLGGEGEHDGDA